jgi:hypothetical protein
MICALQVPWTMKVRLPARRLYSQTPIRSQECKIPLGPGLLPHLERLNSLWEKTVPSIARSSSRFGYATIFHRPSTPGEYVQARMGRFSERGQIEGRKLCLGV